jgi:hypothetical protein
MTPADWSALEQLASAFAAKGVKATPSQVASAIIHKHMAQLRDGREDAADLDIDKGHAQQSGTSFIAKE